jgi:hypothetical protein
MVEQGGVDDLDDDWAFHHAGLARLVDDAHAAPAQFT